MRKILTIFFSSIFPVFFYMEKVKHNRRKKNKIKFSSYPISYQNNNKNRENNKIDNAN